MDQQKQLAQMLEAASKFHAETFGHDHADWAPVYATYLIANGVSIP